ncbi:MAG: hypothetical protein JWN34_1979 [Bryobacterales bacterium]|nr:hypothetical protein [Bryobacterales bacterium]
MKFENPRSVTRLLHVAAALLTAHGCVLAQSAASPAEVTWKRIGGTTVNRSLAGPASGLVTALWYNAQGSGLVVETASGRVLDTTDFQRWRVNASAVRRLATFAISSVPVSPEPGARIQAAGPRLYATAPENIYASDDEGRTWLNLTGFNGRSIIGDGFTALAVSPADPRDISAANQFGVWRSLDGGLSWHSLNQDLPNLPIRRLVGRRSAVLDDNSLILLEGGVWNASRGTAPEAELMARLTRPGLLVSAAAEAAGVTYLGTADGHLLTSRDGGATWADASQRTGSPVGRIWVDAERPDSALASAGNRIYRTVNGGLFWDDVTGTMPSTRVHALAADRSASIIYAATDRGVLTASLSLNDAGPPASAWRSVNRNLPAAAAWDIRLNADNTLTVALDGYGIFETPAPHRSRAIHLVNAADMSDRPAAPGSLLTLLNAEIAQAGIGDLAYPVIAASSQSSQLQVPFEAKPGAYQLAVNGAAGRWSLPLNIRSVAPAVFVDAEGAPLILDSGSGLVMDTNVAVRAGTSVSLLATGLGAVTPEWPAGTPAPFDAPPVVSGSIKAFLDGMPVEVTRATLAPGYVGYYIIELQVPRIVNRGAADLRLVMDGEESNHVRLYLEP